MESINSNNYLSDFLNGINEIYSDSVFDGSNSDIISTYTENVFHNMDGKYFKWKNMTKEKFDIIVETFSEIQNQFMINRGYENEIRELRNGDVNPFRSCDEKRLHDCLMHMYAGITALTGLSFSIDSMSIYFNDPSTWTFGGTAFRLSHKSVQEILEIEYHPEWVKEIIESYQYGLSHLDNATKKKLLNFDPALRTSCLFLDMMPREELETIISRLPRGLSVNAHDDVAPLHSTSYVRSRFSPYIKIMDGRASIRDYYYGVKNAKQDFKDEAIDAGITYGLYKESPTLTTAFLLLIQKIHKYFNIIPMLKDIIDFATRLYKSLKGQAAIVGTYIKDKYNAIKVPKYPTQGVAGLENEQVIRNTIPMQYVYPNEESFDEVDSAPITSTNNSTIFDNTSLQIGNFISENGDSCETIVSLFVGIVFVCVATALGLRTFVKDTSTSFLKKLGSVGISFSGVSRGIDGLISIAGKFDSLVKYCMAYFLGKNENHKLLACILQSGIEDESCFEKAKYMDYIKYITDPKNIHTINASDDDKFVVEKCDEVANAIMTKVANGQLSITRDSLAWFGYIRNEIKKIRQGIHRYPKVDPQRFVPYWINISGEPGVGKSVMIGDLSIYLSKCMYTAGPKYGFKSVPKDDIFNKNFADKFMPGYNGQNILTIDDVFQDASVGAIDQSSAIQLINYISSVPYQPVQASIDEKGMPFTSKLVLTSTNSELPQRMEITSQDALLTRIRKMIRVSWKKGVCGACRTSRGINLCESCKQLSDSTLKRPLQFTVLKLNTTNGATRWEEDKITDWKNLKLTILKEFLEYWQHQTNMLDRAADVQIDDETAEILREFTLPAYSTGLVSMISNAYSATKTGMKKFVVTDTISGWKSLWQAVEFDNIYNDMIINAERINFVSTFACMGPSMCTYERQVMNDNDEIVTVKQLRCSVFEKELWEWIEEFNKTLMIHARMRPNGHSDLKIEDLFTEMYMRYKIDKEQALQMSTEALTDMWYKWSTSIIGSALAVVIGAFVGLISYNVYGKVKSMIVGKSVMSSTHIKYNNGPSRAKSMRIVPAQITSTSFITDEIDNTTDSLLKSMEQHDSICKIKITFPDGSHQQEANGIRVKGTFVLMNAHHVDRVPEGSIMEIIVPNKFGQKIVVQEFAEDRVHRFDVGRNIDAVLYECDSKMPHAKDITKHFLDSDVEMTTTPAMLYTAKGGDSLITYVYTDILASPVKWNYETYNGSNGVAYSVLGFYQINTCVPKGLSGSLLIANNTRFNRKIMGIQVATANTGKCSYIQPITEEMLNKAIGDAVVIVEPDMPEIYSCCKMTEIGEPPENLGYNGLKYIGRIPVDQQMTTAKKTKYEPSVIFEEDEVTQEPSVLSNYDKRMKPELIGKSVMFRNLEKFDKPCGFIRTQILAMVTAWLATWYAVKQKVRGIAPQLLSDYEMVNGCEPMMKQFDMRTSPGYPYVKQRKIALGRGKFEWFDEQILENGKKVYHMKQEVKDRVYEREAQAKKGIRVPTIAYACLKDETRPIEKIKDGKTRVFLCMPMDYNLLTRKYFGAFIMMMHRRAGTFIPSCVGVDPCEGWTNLARRLRSVGVDCEDFDYGGWDTQIHPGFMDSFVEIVNAWYNDGEENALVRKTIIKELSHTFIIAQDKLFQKAAGTCSGFALTAECNSIVNELIMIYCWAILAMEVDPEMCNLESFLENCALGVYGDDIIKAVSKLALWFNGNNIKPIIDELGMEITTGSKDGTDFHFVKLEDLTFLKRSFRPLGYSEYTAPLRKDIIENIPQWVHKSDNPSIATNVNVMTAARNYALWGKNEYDKFCRKVNLRIADEIENGHLDLAPICVTWKEMMNAIRKDALPIE